MENSELSFQHNNTASAIGKIILFLFFGIFLFVGFILLLVGLANLGTDGDIFSALKFMLPGVTLILFVSLGTLYNKISSRANVVKSYFDTVNKRYYLETKNGESGYIPFGEIDSLAMRKEVVSGNKSSTTYYVIYFIKKDGAWWDVFYYMSEIGALKKLNELQEKVKFDRDEEFNLLESEKKSKLFSFAEKDNSVVFKWGEQISTLYRVLGILAVVSFLSTFGIIGSLALEVGSFGFYVLMVFITIFGAAVLYGLFKSIFGYKDYELEITKEKIIFYGVKKENRKILSEVPTHEIKFTQYSFNIVKQDIFNGQEIFLLNQEFADKLNKYKKGDFGIMEIFALMKEIMQMKKDVIKLPFPGFKSLDIILFEKKLDEELRKINPDVK
jgi:nitrate reductase NapE component